MKLALELIYYLLKTIKKLNLMQVKKALIQRTIIENQLLNIIQKNM